MAPPAARAARGPGGGVYRFGTGTASRTAETVIAANLADTDPNVFGNLTVN